MFAVGIMHFLCPRLGGTGILPVPIGPRTVALQNALKRAAPNSLSHAWPWFVRRLSPPRKEHLAEHVVGGLQHGQIGLKQIAGQRQLDQLVANIDVR